MMQENHQDMARKTIIDSLKLNQKGSIFLRKCLIEFESLELVVFHHSIRSKEMVILQLHTVCRSNYQKSFIVSRNIKQLDNLSHRCSDGQSKSLLQAIAGRGASMSHFSPIQPAIYCIFTPSSTPRFRQVTPNSLYQIRKSRSFALTGSRGNGTMAVSSLLPCRLDRVREHVKRGEPDSNSIRSADCFAELWWAKLPGILERLFGG